MKRVFAFFLTLCTFLSVSLPFSATETSAKAAVVIEAASGTALYEKNADTPLPEASTTKIMTALLVLEQADKDRRIRISAKAATVEGSQLGLAAGDELTVRDLLYILMLKSGNDAAVALAECVSGSEEKFVEQMNEKATELGLKNTHFENPHGLPAEGHYTTARDLAELTAVALENSAFRKIVSSRTIRLEYKNLVLTNSNKLLSVCDGVFGVKTGFTKAAGRCLVTAAERRGVTLICVTLNDGNDWQDHETLYRSCFERVSRQTITPQGEYRCKLPVLGGDGNAVLTNALPLTCITIDGIPIRYEIRHTAIPMIFAPVPSGITAGTVTVRSERGRTVEFSPLNVSEEVGQKKEERTFFGSFPLKLRKFWRTLISEIAF